MAGIFLNLDYPFIVSVKKETKEKWCFWFLENHVLKKGVLKSFFN